jgi:beta-glucosidase-like glycosyl hydrolase
MSFLQFMVPRLNGDEIEGDIQRHLALVREGVAGFIVFGGEIEPLREGIGRLQKESRTPLMIASDLEQGLGQQVRGGTLFPPAMAVAEAAGEDPGLLRAVFKCMADEARYAGINTILAPVLDVNTNPENPVISTRAFGEEPGRVSAIGSEMVRVLRAEGLEACGKHFPGHGDTAVDSHISLPRLDKSLAELEACEMVPFRRAVGSGLGMIMLGHLSVPAIEPTGMPVSLSARAVGYLREEMGFKGIVTTDAMNMGGLGAYGAEEAALMALKAGVDVLLHPEEPERLAGLLENKMQGFNATKLTGFRNTLIPSPTGAMPSGAEALCREVTRRAIRVEGPLRPLQEPFVVILNDDVKERGAWFIRRMREAFPSLGHLTLRSGSQRLPRMRGEVIVAAFSEVRGWKGGTSPWVKRTVRQLSDRAGIFVSFGSRHLIEGACGKTRVYAWWDSEHAQCVAADILLKGAGT